MASNAPNTKITQGRDQSATKRKVEAVHPPHGGRVDPSFDRSPQEQTKTAKVTAKATSLGERTIADVDRKVRGGDA